MSQYKHYAESSELSIEESKLKVIRAIPEGRANAIPGGDIAEQIPQKATTLYDMIPELRSQYGIPVGSCSDGYFIVVDPDELQTQIDRYDSQIQTAQTRKQELVEAFNRTRYNDE
jgi:hypothetical protein